MTGRLAGSYFQGNMFIDDYIDHRLEVLGIDLEVLGRWSQNIPDFLQPSATPHSRRIHQALRGFQSATEEGSYVAQQQGVTVMGGATTDLVRVPSHEAIQASDWEGHWLLRRHLTETLNEVLPTGVGSHLATDTGRQFDLRQPVGLSPELRDRFADLGYYNVVSATGCEGPPIELKSGCNVLDYLCVFTNQNVGEMKWCTSCVMVELGLAGTNAHMVLPGYDKPMPDGIMVSGRERQYDIELPVEEMLIEASRDLAFLRVPPDATQGRAEFADIGAMQPGIVLHGGARRW